MQGVEVIPQAEVGDLKLSTAPSPSPRPLAPGAIILASSRPGDEAWMLDAWQDLPTPRPRLVIAPRHLERCDAVAELVAARGLSIARRTGVDREEDVLLVDTFGELSSLFIGAAAAVIGGTLDPAIGGHAPSEAIRAGVSVVGGPYRTANPAAWAAATFFPADATPGSLRAALAEALSTDPPLPPHSVAVAETLARLPSACTPGPRARHPWLWPIVPLVHGIGRLRPAWWQAPAHVAVPVVSVGGLTAGGTGKTPFAGWLAAHIPGAWVVARGHRRGAGPDIRVGHPHQAPSHALGDELEMLRRRGIAVVSAPDRVEGARVAIAEGARCIILDDGFQHRRLHRDVDIVCIDARWPQGGGPIPVGTAREPWSALQRADLVVVLGMQRPAGLPDCATVQARLTPTSTAHLPQDLDLAVGIARPSGVLSMLVSRGHTVRSLTLVEDHGRLPSLPSGCVVTEKDAARLPASADVTVLRVRVEVEDTAPIVAVLEAAGIPIEPPAG
ncbi:MAG TPA: tetraacyldisaccharide 4'-kinase [Deltaproteobacteria bacterium]|nr:tetraacyldisaccharide 4'-kinase [Deltaproteobacteria bacterium]